MKQSFKYPGIGANLGLILAAAIAAVAASAPGGTLPSDAKILAMVDSQNIEALKGLGSELPTKLAELYEKATIDRKIQIAWDLYQIGLKSPEAKRALLRDIKTQNETLRVQVQYALGRVSDDPDVVEILLDGMRNGETYLFRDKAACALAYDQIHLKPAQKIRLFEGLIDALEHEKPDVRGFAIIALRIQTGKWFEYSADGNPAWRKGSVLKWRSWLAEYKAQY